MVKPENVVVNLRGMYRDILRDAGGRTLWDRGWSSNTIVTDCRRLLAGFMLGSPTSSLGIQGLEVGAGLAAWDSPPGLPPPSPGQTALQDPKPATVPRASLQLKYLVGNTVSGTPTNRVQIVATLGPGVPAWPDADHSTSTLREFGLVGQLDGATVLINYVTHPAIAKDPFSTLERTIWLVF
jgi:hypothetical protein